MDDARDELVHQWLVRAARDPASAERLLGGSPPFRDTAAYHLRQAAEKALKAVIVVRDTPVPKSHDLLQLVSILTPRPPAALAAAAEDLNPYSTIYRYPGAELRPSSADIESALQSALLIWRFACDFVRPGLLTGIELPYGLPP